MSHDTVWLLSLQPCDVTLDTRALAVPTATHALLLCEVGTSASFRLRQDLINN